jgi:predicted  nucleic acid-binding Zn-ribbon protein
MSKKNQKEVDFLMAILDGEFGITDADLATRIATRMEARARRRRGEEVRLLNTRLGQARKGQRTVSEKLEKLHVKLDRSEVREELLHRKIDGLRKTISESRYLLDSLGLCGNAKEKLAELQAQVSAMESEIQKSQRDAEKWHATRKVFRDLLR